MGTPTPRLDAPTAAPADESDFVATYRATLGQLVGYFRSKGVPKDGSSDMANETMVRVLVHLKRHGRRERTDLGPLVRTIARNLLIERARRAPVAIVPLDEDVDVPDSSPEPAEHVLAAERREAVRAAIRSLAPRQRRVVGMWMDGRSPMEIARALGVKRNAVDAILHRARRSLAARLEGGAALLGVIGIRVRAFFRRAAEVVSSVDPAGHSTQSGLAVGAVGFAAVLTFGGSAAPTAADGTRSATMSAKMTVDATPSDAVATKPAPAVGEELRPTASKARAARVYEMRIGPRLGADDRDEDAPRIADVTYDPNKNGHTSVDDILQAALDACVATQHCAVGAE
jgi:RNA polymerase sigma-70 factor (ECF subfamily)